MTPPLKKVQGENRPIRGDRIVDVLDASARRQSWSRYVDPPILGEFFTESPFFGPRPPPPKVGGPRRPSREPREFTSEGRDVTKKFTQKRFAKNFLGGVPKKVKDPPHQKVGISHVRKFSSRYPSTRRSRCRSLTKKLAWGKKLPC